MMYRTLVYTVLFLFTALPVNALTIRQGEMLTVDFSMIDSSDSLFGMNCLSFDFLSDTSASVESVTYRLYDEGVLLSEVITSGDDWWVRSGLDYFAAEYPLNDLQNSSYLRTGTTADISSIIDGTGSGRIEYIPAFSSADGFIEGYVQIQLWEVDPMKADGMQAFGHIDFSAAMEMNIMKTTPVAEPRSVSLMLVGMMGLVFLRKRNKVYPNVRVYMRSRCT